MPLRASAQTGPKPTSPTGNSNGEAAGFDARAQRKWLATAQGLRIPDTDLWQPAEWSFAPETLEVSPNSRYFQISNEFGGHPYVASEIGGNTSAKGDVRRPKQQIGRSG